jgi:NAD(P)-dependent dehydrogenase (short-subunit alcohol dehydrogenase family)
MTQFKDKVFIVTGASSGIGKAAVEQLAAAGAKLVINGRRKEPLDAVAKAAGKHVVAVAGDASHEATVEELVAAAVSHFGRLDGAFNNAGTLGEMGPVTGLSRAGWDAALAVNLTSAFLAAKHQVPALLKAGGGSLVFTSTFLGHTASFPGVAAYAASKAGLLGLVQTLAVEYGAQNIRANALMPGAVDTPMYQGMNSTPEAKSFVSGLHALKRVSQPAEMARAALFLLSSDSSFVSGTGLLVDGGLSVNRT